jgi:hypothetical protein
VVVGRGSAVAGVGRRIFGLVRRSMRRAPRAVALTGGRVLAGYMVGAVGRAGRDGRRHGCGWDAPGEAAARARALAERGAVGRHSPSAPFFLEIPISTSEAYSYLRIFF